MKSSALPFVLQALLAALFFGASAPILKLLLGDIDPIYLAAFLYLGSGTGIALVKAIQKLRAPNQQAEAGVTRADIFWLAGAIVSGGIAAPIVLMLSLNSTPASTASLLLNFEGVATTLIAAFVFKESISRRAWAAILVITLASIFLTANFSGGLGLSLGALGIVLACVLWGVDNNFTRNISDKDPLVIVAWKGLVAGTFSFILAVFLGNKFPAVVTILGAMLVGWICYGLSITLFIRSMRGLGAARTSALFGTAPLAGVILSIFMFREIPSALFILAGFLMLGGAYLLVNEEHTHDHLHPFTIHEHAHSHADAEHAHDSTPGSHSHAHEHPETKHNHNHAPDLHHRHGHEG